MQAFKMFKNVKCLRIIEKKNWQWLHELDRTGFDWRIEGYRRQRAIHKKDYHIKRLKFFIPLVKEHNFGKFDWIYFCLFCLAGPHSTISRCPPNEYQCGGTDLCIHMSKLCNGVSDCTDGWDEGPHCRGRGPTHVLLGYRISINTCNYATLSCLIHPHVSKAGHAFNSVCELAGELAFKSKKEKDIFLWSTKHLSSPDQAKHNHSIQGHPRFFFY